ncbi:MAG TPA: DUF2637 domain-containing protein [Micromonosporaceae bacterium]|nr:DUF2637 domain-containing protein [Micromonosporaceae bacterium]
MPRTLQHRRGDRAIQTAAVLTVSGLAALAAWISYHHMLTLAERSGHHGIDAHAFPLTVDGLDAIGMLVLLADRRNGRRSGPLPWIILGVGTLASITANIAVAPDNLVARTISGWTAIALLAAVKMLAHLFEHPHTATPPATNAADAHQRPPGTTVQPAPTSDDDPLQEPALPGPPSRQRTQSDTARRLPTTEATLTRWRNIWHATQHLDAATREVAAQHGVSLRTLQFIRAAGEAGHLTAEPATALAPAPAPATVHPPEPATPQLHPNGTRTSVPT